MSLAFSSSFTKNVTFIPCSNNLSLYFWHRVNKTLIDTIKQTESQQLFETQLLNRAVMYSNMHIYTNFASWYTKISVWLFNCLALHVQKCLQYFFLMKTRSDIHDTSEWNLSLIFYSTLYLTFVIQGDIANMNPVTIIISLRFTTKM
jgi:hypothetical protein